MAKKETPQDIDGASAGRKFRKGEPGLPEQLGEGIIVDGKPLKNAAPAKKAASKAATETMSEGFNIKPMLDKIKKTDFRLTEDLEKRTLKKIKRSVTAASRKHVH